MSTIEQARPAAPPATRPDLDTVLREVNRIRAGRGLDAIYELPQGAPSQPELCVIALALDAWAVSPYGVLWNPDRAYDDYEVKFDHGSALRRFVSAFDRCEYPELIAP